MRSPSTAPPLIGLDGSNAIDGDLQCRAPASAPSRASTSVDLPLPGHAGDADDPRAAERARQRAAAARAPGGVVVDQASAARAIAVAGRRRGGECRGESASGSTRRQTMTSGWPKPRSRRSRAQISSLRQAGAGAVDDRARRRCRLGPRRARVSASSAACHRAPRALGLARVAKRRGGAASSPGRAARPPGGCARLVVGLVGVDADDRLLAGCRRCRWKRSAESPIIRCTRPDSTALYMPPASSIGRHDRARSSPPSRRSAPRRSNEPPSGSITSVRCASSRRMFCVATAMRAPASRRHRTAPRRRRRCAATAGRRRCRPSPAP